MHLKLRTLGLNLVATRKKNVYKLTGTPCIQINALPLPVKSLTFAEGKYRPQPLKLGSKSHFSFSDLHCQGRLLYILK